MKNLNFPLFLSLAFLGMIITITSSSWVNAWLGMELNLLGFLPMMLDKNSMNSYDMIMKYFFISSVSSLLILYFSLFESGMWVFSKKMICPMITLALALKLGLPPFHQWFTNMMDKIPSMPAYLLMTLQKVPPLFLWMFNSYLHLTYLICIIAMIMGPLGAMNSASSMSMMAYSSISHLPWILTGFLCSINLSWLYFFVYAILLLPVILYIQLNKMFMLNDFKQIQNMDKICFSISILSLSGLPPMLGFFPKLFLLFELFSVQYYFLAMSLIFSTMLSIYFYLRLIYNCIFLFSHKLSTPKNYNWIISMSLLSLVFPIVMLFL